MRRIGTLPGERLAERFCDYLQTQGIEASAGSSDDDTPPDQTPHDIWIRHEKDVETARGHFAEFQQTPDSDKYDVSSEAERLRRLKSEEIGKKLARQKNAKVQFSGPSRGAMGGRGGGLLGPTGSQSSGTPVTIAIVVIAVIVGFATSFARPKPSRDPNIQSTEEQILSALSVVDRDEYREGGYTDPLLSIKKGELWRLVTPMFLHGSIMHLAFNMINLFVLGGAVERIHGKAWYIGILLITQVVATLTQILLPDWLESPVAIGASGAVFGVFGFVWIRPKVDRNYPIEIPQFNVNLMLGALIICMTPLIPNIANGAHVGGLIAGVLIAVLAPRP